MKIKDQSGRVLICIIALMLIAPHAVISQGDGSEKKFSQEELDQMLAPIALYPDALLTQILMASTYPLEVVQADRWAKKNKGLKGDALTKALEAQPWDPSVKSLVNFPDVLSMMSENLDLTMKLGDAVLAQQKNVMDTIQDLRKKAEASGNLKTTNEQKVIVEKQTVVIEPANPEVIYVPSYNPTVVYGVWAYPAYPPYPYYPPGYAAGAFATGVAVGAAWGYAWGHSDWHGGDIDIDYDQNININHNIDRDKYKQQFQERRQGGQAGQGKWQHNPSHREGVPYRDQATARKYDRGIDSKAAKSREAYRGRAEQGRRELARGGEDQFKGRQNLAQRGGQMDRGGGAFSGIDRGGSATRSFSNRGSSSRQSMLSGGGRGEGGFGGRGGFSGFGGRGGRR